MPILTSINIWVFVNLTRAIDNNNNNETRIKDKATIEESRYKEEVIFRKRKIITDFRHQEIRYFEGLFLKIGQGQDKTERCNIVAAIQNYLTAFRQTNQHLFTCEDALFDKMNDLKEELTNIQKIDGAIDMAKSVKLKAEISQLLWKYTVDNI